MKINSNLVKRYGIFVFFDKEGIVDDYVIYFLKELKKNLNRLLVICNGNINREGEKILTELSDEYIERENKGFDVTAYKLGLQLHGQKFLGDYDEVVICNATVFGPFYPFVNMFNTMDEKDIDFWGMSLFSGAPFDPFGTIEYGYIPKHIQSYFMVFRKSLHQSVVFWKFFENLSKIRNYYEAIGYFEAVFTKKMEEAGFYYSTYLEAPELDGYTYDILRDFPLYLIKEKYCPVLKRRSFFHEYRDSLERSAGEAAKDILEYIEEHIDYDVDMIWANLLRLQNISDLKKRMHLNYILPVTHIDKYRKKKDKIALILHIYYTEMSDYMLKYIQNMPSDTDVYVTVPSREKKIFIKKAFRTLNVRNVMVRVVKNRGRDVSALLVGCKGIIDKYDIICYLHDKKVTQIKPGSVGESWGYMCLENLLGSKQYVENILTTFEDNPRLGILTPPPPCHSVYYPTRGALEWGPNFQNTKKLAETLRLNVDIDPEKEPIAPIGSYFWFRTDALKDLFAYDWKYEDFPQEPLPINGCISHAVERIYPFVAQNRGYYSSDVLSSRFAEIELTNLDFMIETIKKPLMKKYGRMSHLALVEAIRKEIPD